MLIVNVIGDLVFITILKLILDFHRRSLALLREPWHKTTSFYGSLLLYLDLFPYAFQRIMRPCLSHSCTTLIVLVITLGNFLPKRLITQFHGNES